jgi:hypothetical protein
MRRIYWRLSLLAGLAACSSQQNNTKIVVVVWSDLAVPTEMDSIRIDLQGPTPNVSPFKVFPLTSSNDLPVVLAVVPPNNQDMAFSATASGFLGGNTTPVASQTATLAFLPGESRVLTLFLGRACPSGVCAELTVDPTSLPVYDPKATFLFPDAGAGARLDGGADVGAADVREAETNGVADGGQTGDSAVDRAVDVPVSPFDSGVGDDGGGTGGTGGSGGGTGTVGTGGVGGTTAATGGAGGGGTGGGGGSGGIVTGGTGGSSVADAAVDTLVTPDAAPDVALCGAAGQACCVGSVCTAGGCCVGGTCVGNGATCSSGGTCSNGSCATCDPSSAASQPCSTGLNGICAPGTQKCTAAGMWGPCVQNVLRGTRDCTSKLDNDCDGVADSASSTCVCLAGISQSCVTKLPGICAAGTQQCVLSADKSSTAWGICNPTTQPGTVTEICNGLDDDCNGKVDDVPATVCDVNGKTDGACGGGGTITGCNGTTPICTAVTSGVGGSPAVWHAGTAPPTGSGDWDCDGVTTLSFPAAEFVPCGIRLTSAACTGFRYLAVSGIIKEAPLCGQTFSGTSYFCASGISGCSVSGTGTLFSGYTQNCH